MSFFTDGPRERPLFPVREQELFGYEGRPWMGPPNDHIVPALLPWARPLGRSERTIVALRGIEVWPEALTLRLAVYSRDSLQEGRSGSLIDHRRIPDYNALLVGVLYPDGSRASSESISVPSASEPAQPVLRAVGGGGTQFHLDHQIFLWPLPGDGPFTLVIQWLDRDIKETHTELDGAAIRAAAEEAGELWPGLPKRPGNGVALRNAAAADSGAAPGVASGSGAAPGVASGSGADGALPVRAPESAEPLPRRDAADSAAPGERLPQRSPSVLLPRLAGEASLLPRRNVALGPDRPVPRPPGTASPLPRRTPTRAGSPLIAHPPNGLAEPPPHPAQTAPPRPPAEPPPLSRRNTDDSPTVALPTPAAADPLPQPSRPAPPQSAGDTPPLPQRNAATHTPAPLPQPSAPQSPGEALTVAQPPALPQPSRPAKEEKPARGGWARRWGARDPGE